MKPEDAEEYTQALGQVVAGGWRQIALGQRLGVPKALGLTTDKWVKQRLGGYVKYSVEERQQAAAELKKDGRSQREIAAVLGVTKTTVLRDLLDGPNRPAPDASLSAGDDGGGPNGPLDVLAGLAVTNDARHQSETKAARATREEARDQERQANAAKVADVSDPRELLKGWSLRHDRDRSPVGFRRAGANDSRT